VVVKVTSLREIVKYLEKIAPHEYTLRNLDSHVEIGPQSETDQQNTTIHRVTIAIYPSARVITTATQDKSNLLITHKPLFPYAVDRLTGLDLIRVRLLTKNYISAYVIGSAWIGARDGLADALVEALEFKSLGDFVTTGDYSEMVPLGRLCRTTKVMNHSRLANHIAELLGVDSIISTANLDDEVETILVVPGDLIDMPEIISAKKKNIKTIVTGELPPQIRILAHEESLNVLEAGAFATEDKGVQRLKHQMTLEFPELTITYAEPKPFTKILNYDYRKM
jgi:putative NIF3 family GTP cyclohydrolase 1 type 2